MEQFKYITVLDYTSGRVYQYDTDEWNMEADEWNMEEDVEDFLAEQGHNTNDCHWMVHKNYKVI